MSVHFIISSENAQRQGSAIHRKQCQKTELKSIYIYINYEALENR